MIRTHILPRHLSTADTDALNAASGQIYTLTLVTHYRVYRKQGTKTRHWLSPGAGEQLNDFLTRHDPPLLHAHSKDAAQQGFYKACTTARVNRRLGVTFPYKRKRWRTTMWKQTGIRQDGDRLVLSRAKGLPPITVHLPDAITTLPVWSVREVRLVWDRCARRYTWHLVIEHGKHPASAPGTKTVAVDLGELHPAAATDGDTTVVFTARDLRARRQDTAKRLSTLQAKQSRLKQGSRRWKRLQRCKTRFRAKQRRRIRDIEHKVSRAVVNFAVERQAGTLVIGDVRAVANGKRLTRENQQKISTWAHGRMRQLLTYKADAQGITVELVNEQYSTQTCPNPSCNHRHKPTGRVYRCPVCGLQAHRDAVGSVNLLSCYTYGAVGKLLPPPQTMYRIPYNRRVLRSRPDTGRSVLQQAVACAHVQEAAGL